PAALGGHRISVLRLVRGERMAEAALPFAGIGLSRFRLDEALLAHAAASGARVRRASTITGVRRNTQPDGRIGERSPGTLTLDMAGLPAIQASTLFLATGKHDLRGLRRLPARVPEDLIGFKAHFALAADQVRAVAGHVEVIMFPDGYAGLQLVEAGRANLCLLTSRQRLRRCGGQWDAVLADLLHDSPHLRRRLAGAAGLAVRPATIYRVPYGFVHTPSAADAADVFRLGDQIGVIPSFAGDGMSIALHSASVAVACYLAGLPAIAYHRRMRRDISRQIRRASALYSLARWSGGQAVLMALACAWPGGVRIAARLTQLPERAEPIFNAD
ncbi:MAG: hypothetical protein ACREFY_20305, partial [Acetobacteraceae bacterium]